MYLGKLDVAAAVGKGFITVVRNNPFWKQPYTGITQIVSVNKKHRPSVTKNFLFVAHIFVVCIFV